MHWLAWAGPDWRKDNRMLAKHLLLLYPRAWRQRYGEEFLTIIGQGSLRLSEVIDIASGAIDAWLSADVRRTTLASQTTPVEGGSMSLKTLLICEPKHVGVTPRDGLIGAAIMLGAALLFRLLSVSTIRAGFPLAGELLKSLVFPGSFTISMPFWLMKGQPWKAQLAIIGGTLVILVLLGHSSPAR